MYNYFLVYLLVSQRNQLSLLSSGSTFLELSRQTFSKFKILLPPLPEQEKIADILTSIDKSIEVEEAKKAQVEIIKKGLMQQLLTEKIRVKVSSN